MVFYFISRIAFLKIIPLDPAEADNFEERVEVLAIYHSLGGVCVYQSMFLNIWNLNIERIIIQIVSFLVKIDECFFFLLIPRYQRRSDLNLLFNIQSKQIKGFHILNRFSWRFIDPIREVKGLTFFTSVMPNFCTSFSRCVVVTLDCHGYNRLWLVSLFKVLEDIFHSNSVT